MPGFDGTGPRGMGPMTGGGRGFCNPYTAPYRSFAYPGLMGGGMGLGAVAPMTMAPAWPAAAGYGGWGGYMQPFAVPQMRPAWGPGMGMGYGLAGGMGAFGGMAPMRGYGGGMGRRGGGMGQSNVLFSYLVEYLVERAAA